MSVKFTSGVSLGLGLLGSLTCLLMTPLVFNEIGKIRLELADEMQVFKVR